MEEKIYYNPSGKIHYWTNKINEKKPTLVFLPGLTANHHLFDKQLEYFKSKYNILIWDPPGHGKSRPYQLDFSLRDKAYWLNQILKIEKINKPVLIGQSMGGYVSQMYIHEFPGEVLGFISIDSSSLNRSLYSSLELKLLKHMEPVYRYFPWKLLLKTGPIGCSKTEYGRNLMFEMMQDYSGQQSYFAKLAGHGFKILSEVIDEDLKIKFNCPVLLICGKKDQAGSTKHYNKKWYKDSGLPLYWIPGAGHNSNSDQPKLVNLLIEIFIKKLLSNTHNHLK